MTRTLENTAGFSLPADDGNGDGAISRLAIQIVASCHGDPAQTPDGQLISLPSERELSTRLGMSRHAVRNALSHLQRRGLVCRPNGRGPLLVAKSIPAVQTPEVTTLQCINFVINAGLDNLGLHWLRDEYLSGYTEVLEHQSCKTRHVIWKEGAEDYDSLLWCHSAPQKQGCLIIGRRDPALLSWLRERSVPFVVQNYALYDYHQLPPHHKVYVNKAGGSFAAVRHLMDLGHRRIGFVGPMPLPNRSWPEFEGYHAALRCAGLTPDPEDQIDMCTEYVNDALPQCQRLLDRPNRPTAVVSGIGAVTVALKEAAKSLGLRLPQDLSVIGFDSVDTSPHPDLSTIAVPRRPLSRQAVELLLDAARTPDMPAQTRVLDCQLNLQKTVGPVPA